MGVFLNSSYLGAACSWPPMIGHTKLAAQISGTNSSRKTEVEAILSFSKGPTKKD